jgi:hypothetical protein
MLMMLLRDAIKGLLDETKHHEVASELLGCWAPVYLWYQEACGSTIEKQSAYEPFLGNGAPYYAELQYMPDATKNTTPSEHGALRQHDGGLQNNSRKESLPLQNRRRAASIECSAIY